MTESKSDSSTTGTNPILPQTGKKTALSPNASHSMRTSQFARTNFEPSKPLPRDEGEMDDMFMSKTKIKSASNNLTDTSDRMSSASTTYKRYHNNDRVSRKILALKAFEMKWKLCFYRDSSIEQQFLIAQFLQFRVRQLVFFLFTFFGQIVMTVTGSKDHATILFAIPPIVLCIVIGLIDVIVVGLSRNYRSASLPRAGFARGESRDFFRLLLAARVHEALTAFTTLFLCAYYPIYLRWKMSDCEFSRHYDASIESGSDVGCQKVHIWWFLFIMIPLIVGQPRFAVTCCCFIFTGIFMLVNLRFHDTSMASTVLILAIYTTHVIFMSVFKCVLEQQDRRRFEADALLRFKTEEVEARYNDLREFVLSITPPYLRNRLNSSTLQVDCSKEALALVVNVHNVGSYAKSMLPADAATSIAAYCFQCETEAKEFGFHHIRSVGDTNYLVANLFRRDFPTTFAGLVSGLKFATQTTFVDDLQSCVGLCTGFMTGLPVGTTCIRYDIFGSCINFAQNLSLSSPPGCCQIPKDVFEYLGADVVRVTGRGDGSSMMSSALSSVTSNSTLSGSTIHITTGESITVGGVRELHEWSLEAQNRMQEVGSPVIVTDNGSRGVSSTSETPSINMWDALKREENQIIAVQLPHAKGNEIPEGPAGVAEELETVNDCIFLRRFAQSHMHALADKQQRRHFKWAFIACLTVYIVQSVLSIAIVAEERYDDVDSSMMIFFAAHTIAIVGFVVIALTALSRFRSEGRHSQVHLWSMYSMCTIALFGHSFGRPSSVADNSAFLLWTYAFGVMFSGGRVKQVLCMQFIWVVIFYVTALTIRPVVEASTLLVALGGVILANVAILHNKLQIELLSNLMRSKEALKRVEALEAIRQAVFDSTIPPAVQHHITPETLAHDSVDCWSSDQCVVMTIKVAQDEVTLANLVNDPHELKEYAESATMLVEQLVQQTPNRTLNIVKIFGGVITIAGPLAGNTQSSASGKYLLAVDDAFHLLHRIRECADDMRKFTITIVNEQVINVLRFSEYPTFELMGPVISISRAMMMACPTDGMVVTTEKLAQLYQRELPDSAATCMHQFGASESWRFRDVGILRITRVQPLK